jgi:hypothetical protein
VPPKPEAVSTPR